MLVAGGHGVDEKAKSQMHRRTNRAGNILQPLHPEQYWAGLLTRPQQPLTTSTNKAPTYWVHNDAP